MTLAIYNIRKLRVTDLYQLNKMYDSLLENTKRFFHPGFLGYNSINASWALSQLAMAASSSMMLKKLLVNICPSAAFLAIVSIDNDGKIVGFAYIKRKRRNLSECHGEIGICVIDGYQGRHIGSKMMDYLL